MKLRILNAGHAVIAYPAALLGIEMVHDAMADPHVLAFLRKIVREEMIPSVPAISGVNFDEYYADIEKRFSNEAVADTIPRLCQDGSNRQPKFILPSVAERVASALPVPGLALEVALWCRYCAGTDENGRIISIDDPMVDQISAKAIAAKSEPTAFLELESVFGTLGSCDAFRQEFTSALNSVWRDGVRSAIAAYAGGV